MANQGGFDNPKSTESLRDNAVAGSISSGSEPNIEKRAEDASPSGRHALPDDAVSLADTQVFPKITAEMLQPEPQERTSLSELKRSATERRARMRYRESGMQAIDEEERGRLVLQPAMKIKASSITEGRHRHEQHEARTEKGSEGQGRHAAHETQPQEKPANGRHLTGDQPKREEPIRRSEGRHVSNKPEPKQERSEGGRHRHVLPAAPRPAAAPPAEEKKPSLGAAQITPQENKAPEGEQPRSEHRRKVREVEQREKRKHRDKAPQPETRPQPELKISQLDTSTMTFRRSGGEQKKEDNTQPLYSIEELRRRSGQRSGGEKERPWHSRIRQEEGKVISTPERFTQPRRRGVSPAGLEKARARTNGYQPEAGDDGESGQRRREGAEAMPHISPRTVRMLAIALAVLLVLAGGITAGAVLFRLENIQVIGNIRYSDEDILELANVQLGDNLLLVRKKTLAERLSTAPNINVEDISINMPGSLSISIFEKNPAAVIYSGGTYITIDSRGEVLGYATDQTKSADLISIEGVEVSAANAGERLEVAETHKQKFDCVLALLDVLSNEGALELCDRIDVNNVFNIKIDCGNGLYVNVGDSEDLEYKAVVIKTMITQLKGKGKKGMLYITGRKGANFMADDLETAEPTVAPQETMQPEEGVAPEGTSQPDETPQPTE